MPWIISNLIMNFNVDQNNGQNNLMPMINKLILQVRREREEFLSWIFNVDLDVQQIVAKGQNLTRELNTCLHTTTVQNKEENQLRELHSWACDSLMEYLQVLQPFASGSYARLDNIAHHLGVTDRYIGYRHNLTRSGNQPLSVHTVWADRKLPRVTTAAHQQSAPDWKNWVHGYRRMATACVSFEKLLFL